MYGDDPKISLVDNWNNPLASGLYYVVVTTNSGHSVRENVSPSITSKIKTTEGQPNKAGLFYLMGEYLVGGQGWTQIVVEDYHSSASLKLFKLDWL